MARTVNPVTVTLADIDLERSTVFQRVFSAVLQSTAGVSVFAQIIDGLPVNKTYDFMTTCRIDIDARQEPTEEARSLVHSFYNSLGSLDSLEINAKVGDDNTHRRWIIANRKQVAQLYQSAPLLSASFNMHLLELVAVAFHDLAGTVFCNFHPDGEPLAPDSHNNMLSRGLSLSTRLYIATRCYSRGRADVVGY